jgi:hypothetical protein
MTGGEKLLLCIWGVAMIYFPLCIWIPEIRPYWKGTQRTIGPVSNFGCAMFVWCPALALAAAAIGLISDAYTGVLYLLESLAIVLVLLGFIIDMDT